MEAWEEEEEAEALRMEEASLKVEAKVWREEAEKRRIAEGDQGKTSRRASMQMYTLSPQGLRISE